MSLQSTGYLEDSKGREAEELVLEAIIHQFHKDYARVFINHNIPGGNPPDFVVPVCDREGNFKILIVECKAAKAVNIDGSTFYKDTYAQVMKYKDALSERLRPFKQNCEIECIAVHPGADIIPHHLYSVGRNGIRWMNLTDFKAHILRYEAIGPYSKYYKTVQMIYSQRDLLQKCRLNYIFADEQKKILNWGFGKVKKIGGLAGTGKSLLLARKLINDIKGSNGQDFLYLTHNKNLVFKFVEYLEDFLILDNLPYEVETVENYSKKIHLEIGSRKVTIHLYNFDRFSTQCITRRMDRILNQRWENGKNLHSLTLAIRKTTTFPTEATYKEEREKLFSILSPIVTKHPDAYAFYDALYIDEFQDCRIDPSRYLLPSLFVKKSEGEINLSFSEDPLQSYVKFKVLQELDESFTSIRRKDFVNYDDLGLPAGLHGRVVILHKIYRTPSVIFRSAVNILEYHGGLLKTNSQAFDKLSYDNKQGTLNFINQKEVDFELKKLMNKEQRFPHEIIVIERMRRKQNDRITNQIRTPLYIPKSSEEPAKDKTNLFNELNVRGLESLCVFIVVDEELVKQPNFIYTLMCRTQRELYLVKAETLPQKDFDEFKRSLMIHDNLMAS